jgi:hypothetical protein
MPCRAITPRQAASTSSQVAPGLAAAKAAFRPDHDLLRCPRASAAACPGTPCAPAGSDSGGGRRRAPDRRLARHERRVAPGQCGVEVPMPVGSIGTNEV